MISAVDLLSSNRDIWNRVGGDRLEQLRQPEVAEEEIMFATVAGGGKNFLHGNRQENPRLNRHAMENSEAFSWEHEKANRAKTDMNCTFFVQMKAASMTTKGG